MPRDRTRDLLPFRPIQESPQGVTADALRPLLREILSAYRELGEAERNHLLNLAERMSAKREAFTRPR